MAMHFEGAFYFLLYLQSKQAASVVACVLDSVENRQEL
jgi:hypothetical protein